VALPALDNTVTLPVSALYGTNRVYRITDERIEAVTINVLGNQADAEGKTRVIIDKGALRDGERIVTTQLPSAITGMKVQLRENASE
jgi:multidrug efflux pump subunit AcrA (membrane-fusion protein)